MREASREPEQAIATLAELKPVLALFAQALAGRPMALRDDGAAPGHTPAHDGGASPAVQITLPAQIASFATVRDNRAAYRIAVLRAVLAQPRDESLPDLHAGCSVVWRRLFRSLERLRIDSAIVRSYPGARPDLARQRAHELAQREASPPRRWPLTRALEAVRRHAAGDSNAMWATADETLAMHTALRHADTLSQRDARSIDSARVASLICSLLGARTHTRRRTVAGLAGGAAITSLDAPGSEPSDPRATDIASAAAADVATDAIADTEGAVDTAGAIADPTRRSAAPTTHAPRSSLRKQTRPATVPQRPAAPRAQLHNDDEPHGLVHAIDEWDYRQQRLLPAWCTLLERRMPGGDTAFIHHVRRRHAELARRVHRQFAAWRPDGLQRVHGASDGDELELDRVIEAMVDRRAGLIDDRAWYLRRDRAQRDVATAFLVDTSASTDFVLPGGTVGPPRPAPSAQADAVYLYDLALSAPPSSVPKRRVIDVAKDALALMCDALHTLGDCFAVYTFSGQGRKQVDFRVVKAFEEAVSSRTAAALAALRPHGATRTGAAIRHAAAQLARQPQRRRTLIVVTDGYPEDIDYGPEPRDLRYGVEDTAHALQEAQALGVHTFCLSIDPAGHDYLRRMCPRERYMVITDLHALPGELAKVYQAMTRSTHGA